MESKKLKALIQYMVADSLQGNKPVVNLKKAYEKDYQNLLRMIKQFKTAYEYKNLTSSQFATYTKNIQEIQLFHTTFLKNTFKMLDQQQINEIVRNIEYLMYDHVEKNKALLKTMQEKDRLKFNKNSNHTQKLTNTCERCHQNIRKVNLQQLKEYLQTQYMGTLDRIILQAKIQIQEQVFTEQQDELFFKQLHKTLKKRHQHIELNVDQINGLINTINKELNELDVMKKLSVQESFDFQAHDNQWVKNIQKSFSQLMLISFKKKIPLFLESMLNSFASHFQKLYKKQTSTKCSQTDPYEIAQLNEFNEKLYKLKSLNFKLQNDIKWLEKQLQQKSTIIKQKQKEYRLQMEDNFNKINDEKQIIKKLQANIDMLKKQIGSVKQQVHKKNESITFYKKKLSKIQKEKLKIQIQHFQNTAQKEYFYEKNLQLHNEMQSKNNLESQQNKQRHKLRIRSKKLITKISTKNINQSLSPEIYDDQVKDKKSLVSFRDGSIEKQNDLGQNEVRKSQPTEIGDSPNQEMKQNFNSKEFTKMEKENLKADKKNQERKQDHVVYKKFSIQKSKEQIRRVNQKIKQKIRESNNLQKVTFKKINFFKIKSKGSLDTSQIKFKTTKQVEPVKASKRVHFRSHTMINNFKHSNSKIDQQTDKFSSLNNQADNFSIRVTNQFKNKDFYSKIQNLLLRIQNELPSFTRQGEESLQKVQNLKINKMINDFLIQQKSYIGAQQVEKQSQNDFQKEQVKKFQNNESTKDKKSISFFKQNNTLKKIVENQIFEDNQKIQIKRQVNSHFVQHKSLVTSKHEGKLQKKKSKNFLNNQKQKNETIKRRPVFKSVSNTINCQKSSQQIKNQPQKQQYLEYIQNCGQKIVLNFKELPKKINPYEQKIKIFKEDDFQFFINEAHAYLYECNHMKTYHKNNRAKLNQSQQKLLSALFNKLERIKRHNNYFYQQIISFIRYPYQTVKNLNFGTLIVKGMKFQNFINFMQRVLYLHKKCQILNQNGFCEHFNEFNKKILSCSLSVDRYSE